MPVLRSGSFSLTRPQEVLHRPLLFSGLLLLLLVLIFIVIIFQFKNTNPVLSSSSSNKAQINVNGKVTNLSGPVNYHRSYVSDDQSTNISVMSKSNGASNYSSSYVSVKVN